ncbi:hypothetical protein [Corticimicrobacter populi]|uniref:Uncharacterized protein n=1 Tax=Corticimicrobacter populi TaxID=2175229 RepID=A0A2V1JXK7_9BURK|nr:hypothetical protein [Corticimicrobacter populi]PWF23220.1 hypothetical protein DD235_09535 [Corticimicrobacter populi]
MAASVEIDLFNACKEVARRVLWQNGAASSDVVETLAGKFLAIAEEHQDFVRKQRETDVVIAQAVRYIAHVHAIPPAGTDTQWFRNALAVLMELAVPNTGLDEEVAQFLSYVQEGIRESLANVSVSRSAMRIEDEDAAEISRMQDAGIEYGVTSDLLDLIEKLFHGDPLTEADQRFFHLAAVAAPMTRPKRAAKGLE